ncbi:MAG: ABC transporter ATP-binding protein [Clostridiales bacterium]|nr:ABC transporter ATP-binding protein [Clostridiales bacterium]
MNAIETEKLTKCFRDRRAVDALDLTVGAGEFFALLGQNGAGKTTTIRMLSGLLAPTDGEAFIMGNSIHTAADAAKACCNISPQETAVAENLTVKENLVLVARLYGVEKTAAEHSAETLLAEFGLEERAASRAKTLSGGMKRRLSIAMALITEPKVLFLDEPTLGLDVRARRELWKMITALKGKMTLVLTTHYLEEAEALSDRIGIMHKGRLAALGTAYELCAEAGAETFEDAFLYFTEEESEETI